MTKHVSASCESMNSQSGEILDKFTRIQSQVWFINVMFLLKAQRHLWDILQGVQIFCKFFRSLVHKKNFSLIWQVGSELRYLFF